MWFPIAIAAVAQAGADDVLGASALGVAGAVVASPDDNATITVNPGAIGLTERYDLAGHFGVGPWPAYELSANALDARTVAVSMGLSYRFRHDEPAYTDADLPGWTLPGVLPTNKRDTHDIALSLAYPLLDRKLSFGLGASVSIQDHARLGTTVGGNLDVGLAARPIDALSLGVVGRSLLPLDPLGTRPGVVAGIRGIAKDWGFLEADVGWQSGDDPLVLHAGAELLRDTFHLRLGADHEASVTRLCFGLGFDSEGASLDYALAVPLGGTLRLGSTVHVIGIRIRT